MTLPTSPQAPARRRRIRERGARTPRTAAPATFERFTQSLAYRGPDGVATATDAEACLAFGYRPLSIFDPSIAATHPMGSLDGRYRTVFNGEIYNFVEFRAEFESAAYDRVR